MKPWSGRAYSISCRPCNILTGVKTIFLQARPSWYAALIIRDVDIKERGVFNTRMMKLLKKNYKGIKEYAEKRKLSMMLNVLKVCGGGIRKCNSFSEKN